MVDQVDPMKVHEEESAPLNKYPMLSKESISSLPFTLENLMNVLKQAYDYMDHVGLSKNTSENNLIVAIGNTGCGKSTMLTSLVYGPEALSTKKLEYEVQLPLADGSFKVKVKKRVVID